MRKVIEVAEQNKDKGTLSLVVEYIRNFENTSRMLDAWIIKHQEKQYS